MIKRPAASFIRTVALCSPPCLLSVSGRGRDESGSEGAEREKPCKSGRIQAAVSSCISVNHQKYSKGRKKRQTVFQIVGLVYFGTFVRFWLLQPERRCGNDWAVFAPNKKTTHIKKAGIYIKNGHQRSLPGCRIYFVIELQTQPLEWTRPRDGCQSVQARDAGGQRRDLCRTIFSFCPQLFLLFFFHLLGLWFWRHDWIWANAAIHKGQLLLCKHAACTLLPTFTCRYTCANGLKRKEIDGNPFLTSLKSLDGAFFCWIKGYMHFFFLPKPENISCKVPKKEDASSCQFECSEPHWPRYLPLSSVCSCTLQVTPNWGLIWRQRKSQLTLIKQKWAN